MSRSAVLACLGFLLSTSACAPREPTPVPRAKGKVAHTAHTATVVRASVRPASGKPASARQPAHHELTPAPAVVEPANETAGAELPRSVPAAMNAIRRATTEAERRRAVTAFISNASFMANTPVSVELLLETLKLAPEHDVVMAVQQVLGQAPDTAVPFMAALLYQDATTAEERERLLGVIRHAQTPGAISMLAGLADASGGQYAQPLALAAVDTLGVIGSPAAVRDLTGRITTGDTQGQNVQPLVAALSRTVNPDAFDLLAAAARGEGSADAQVRLASLNALGNYPTVAARAALQQIIAQETDADLLAAAKKALKRASLELPEDFAKP